MNTDNNCTGGVSRAPVLLVDDDETILFSCRMLIRSSDSRQEVLTLQDSRDVMDLLGRQEISGIVLDLSMPHLHGKELLMMIKRDYPDMPVIIMTGMNEVDMAVQCMKDGAFDYIVKPAEDARFVSAVKRAVEMSSLKQEVTSLKRHLLHEELEHAEAFSSIITASRPMFALFHYIEVIAPSAYPVLITGETGTGKELVARALHTLSGRTGRFVAVNIAGLDDAAFSDALFGHKKGAFTGADAAREGFIASASDGTIFLDEIGDLKEEMQLKILRLLQEYTYYPLGSDLAVRSNARVVVATNRDLNLLIDQGNFRKDLYYRLRSHQLHIPPLRERQGDIPLLVDYFLKESSSELGKKVPAVPDELYQLLASYHFPGNVRELRSMIHDAVAMHERGMLSLARFRETIRHENLAGSEKAAAFIKFGTMEDHGEDRLPTLQEAEKYLISESLKRAGGNQGIAAAMLGLTRQALNKRLVRKGRPE